MTVKELEEKIKIIHERLDAMALEIKTNNDEMLQKIQEIFKGKQGASRPPPPPLPNFQNRQLQKKAEDLYVAPLIPGRQKEAENLQITPIIQGRTLKIDFPRFTGTDPEGWLYQAEIYRELNGILDTQMVSLAAIHLQGDAIAWYRWLRQSVGVGCLSWEQFLSALCSRFGSCKNIDPCSSLSKLTQTGTVLEFITEFEKLINLVPGMRESHQVSIFLSGLRTDIGAGVRFLRPLNLSEAFDLALCQEEAILATSKFSAEALTPPKF
ncbi:hypothetical protein ACHQM5_015256 [Ranunculus cassubicifolius]